MDWYEVTSQYHQRAFGADGDLSSLPHEWQRELAALWRLEADVNNGTYLQFIENWGLASYGYASTALYKIGANTMAHIIDECHNLVTKDTDRSLDSSDRFRNLMPNPIVGTDGVVRTPPPSPIPQAIIQRIYDLS